MNAGVWHTMVRQGWSADAAAAYLGVEADYAKQEMDRVRGYTLAQAAKAKADAQLRSNWGMRLR
jgi:hypothetical protein